MTPRAVMVQSTSTTTSTTGPTAGPTTGRPAAPRAESPVTDAASNTPLDATSVADLLLAAGNGSSAAWEEIVRRYGRLVWARVRAFRLQDADAYDATQMTWLRLAENLRRVQHPERLAGWLATTANRECLRILRQASSAADPGNVAETVADPSASPEQRVIDAYTTQALRSQLDRLSPRGRFLLLALFADNPRPYAELARATGIPIGSIGPTRTRALQQLRQMMTDEDGLGVPA